MAYFKSRHTLKSQDAYLASLALSDLLQALIGYPAEIRSLIKDEPQQSETEICRWTGFVVTFLGLVSINHLMFMSIERALVVSYPFSTIFKSKKFVLSLILVSWILGFFWAFFPLVGWSSYATEKDNHRCSINWVDETASGKMYVYTLFAFQFMLPVIIIFISFAFLRFEMKRMMSRVSENNQYSPNEDASGQRKTTRMIIVITIAFFVSWTPYAVVSLYTTLTADKMHRDNEKPRA